MLIRRAIWRFGFLEKNSRVLVAVSGGVDSLVLLALLLEYNNRFQPRWEIHTCHINPQFPEWRSENLKKIFVKYRIPYTIIKTNINKKIEKLKKRCYLCARERRKSILGVADKLGIFQIALAHHKEDIVETLLLNMIYNGEISTSVPNQSVIQGRFHFIRPLYYFDTERIQNVARIYKLPKNDNICPYYKESKREVIRNFLAKIKKENPNVYKNCFNAIFNIKNSYLPH